MTTKNIRQLVAYALHIPITRTALKLFAALLLLGAANAASANEAQRAKIAVFDIELEDTSAGGGVIPKDDFDRKYLKEATEEAKTWLSKSDLYDVVDTSALTNAAATAGTLHDCPKCVAEASKALGAAEAMVGTITRINRTEYTLQIQFFDTNGNSLRNYYTNLRMGANYAWPRGVAWLMKNQILASKN